MDIPILSLLLLFMFVIRGCYGQLNTGNRQVIPPRIAPSNPRTQQQHPTQRLNYRQFAPNSPYFSSAILAQRLNRLETEMSRISASAEAVGSSLRVTLSQTLTERLSMVRQEISGFDARITGNENKVRGIEQEVKYLKNSNAHMQRRLDNLEETQRRHETSIQSFAGVMDTIQQDSAAPSIGEEILNTFVNRSELSRLSDAVERVKLRMNDSETVIGGYSSYFQSFADNLGMLSKKTETLQLESSIITDTLSEIHENIYNIRADVDNLSPDEDAVTGVMYGPSYLDDIQASVDELTETIQTVEAKQQLQESSLQNLTRLVESSDSTTEGETSNNYRASSSGPRLNEITASVTHLQNALRRTNEDQRLTYGQVQLRLSELKADYTTQQDEVSRLNGRLDGLQQSQETNQHLRNLSDTVTRHDQILLDMVSGPPSLGGIPLNAPLFPDSGPPSNASLFINGNSSSEYPPGVLDDTSSSERIRQLEEYLANNLEQNILNIQNEMRGLQFSVGSYSNRLESMSARISYLESSSDPGALPGSLPFNSIRSGLPQKDDSSHHIDRILSDVEALNASVAAQSNMLAQGFQQLGDYDRRLRVKELDENPKHGELQEIRILLQNATMSLSQMSMTIAEHELTIPNIFDSLNTGHDIIIDLNNEMYKHEMALKSMNRTISHIENTLTRLNATAANKISNHGQGPNGSPLYVTPKDYVKKSEFNVLAERLAALSNGLSPSDRSLTSTSSDDVIGVTSERNKTDAELVQLRADLRVVQRTVDFQQNAINLVTQSANNLLRDLSDVRGSMASVVGSRANATQSNDVTHAVEGLRSGMRRLSERVIENRKILGNQRKRFRIFEFLKRSCARHSDVTELNETITAEIHSLHHAMESVASNMSTVSNKIPSADEFQNSTSFGIDCATFDITNISDLVDQVKNLSNQVDEIRRVGATTLNINARQSSVVPDDLQNIPTAIRLLETQIQSFQDVVVALPSLDNKIEALKGMRNLVFQNSQGISSFHETVVAVERNINTLQNDVSKMESKQRRLEAYHDDLRTNLNETKRAIDNSDDRSISMSRDLVRIERVLRGNFTELRDEAASTRLRLQSIDDVTADFSLRIGGLETELEQELLTVSIRHNDLDHRAKRMQVAIDDVIETATENSDVIDKFNRSLRDERTLRARTDGEQEVIVLGLRESLSNLQQEVSDHKVVTSQYESRLSGQELQQQRNTGEIGRLETANQDAAAEVATLRNDVISSSNDVTLLNDRVNNVEDGLSEMRETITAQANNHLQLRQNLITTQDELNAAKQTIQVHDSFKRRAEQIIDKHRNDISYIIQHSSNHTVAIERLKQRVGSTRNQAYTNLTEDILNEVELLEANLRTANAEITNIKRQDTIRDTSVLDLESSISDLRNSALDYQSKIRTNKELVERNKNLMSRQSARLDDLERSAQEQRIANSDLQQVVQTNRNEITLLSNVQTSVVRMREDFSRVFSQQENRTNSLRQTVDGMNNRVAVVQSEVDGHERTLNTMRQDRISLDADIEQIYRSSGGLEEILRKTTTDVQLLRREFDSSLRQLDSLRDLEQRSSAMQSSLSETKQTISTNENKISRLQGALERMGTTLDRTIANVNQQQREGESRDRARTNEIREIRQGLDRVPVMLRSIRNELTRHSDRLRFLNERIVVVDGRIDRRQPRTDTASPQITKEPPKPLLTDAMEASGWIPVETTHNSNENEMTNDGTTVTHVTNVNHGLIALAQQVVSLGERIDLLNASLSSQPNVGESSLFYDDRTILEVQDKLVEMEVTQQTISDAVSSLGGDVFELSNRVGTRDHDEAELQKQFARLEGKFDASRNDKNEKEEQISLLQKRIGEVESNVEHRISEQVAFVANLSDSVQVVHDAIQSIHTDVTTSSDVRRSNMTKLNYAIENIEIEIQNFAAHILNVTQNLERTNHELSRKSAHGDDDVLTNLTSQLNALAVDVSVKLNKLLEDYDGLKDNSSLHSRKGHTHEVLERNVAEIRSSMRDMSDRILLIHDTVQREVADTEVLTTRVANVEGLTNNHESSINTLLDERALVSSRIGAQEQQTNTMEVQIEQINENLGGAITLPNEGASLPNEIKTILSTLTDSLMLSNATAWTLAKRSTDIETAPLEGDYEFYEVEPAANSGPSITAVNYENWNDSSTTNNSTLQDFLRQTNTNIGRMSSNLITALNAMLESLPTSSQSKLRTEPLVPSPNTDDALGDVIIDFSDRLVNMETLVLSINASLHAFSPNEQTPKEKVEVEEISRNLTELRRLIEELDSAKQHSQTLSKTLLRKVESIRDDVATHGAHIFNVLGEIQFVNNTVQEVSDTQSVQHYVLSNLLQQQEQHSATVAQWRSQMDTIEIRLEGDLSGIRDEITEDRKMLEGRLVHNLTSLATKLNEAKALAENNRDELRERFDDTEGQNVIDLQLNLVDNQINDINNRLQGFETALGSSMTRTAATVQEIELLKNFVPLLQNQSHAQLQQIIASVDLQLDELRSQSVIELTELQSTMSTLTASLMMEDRSLANKLNNINATVRQNSRDVVELRGATGSLSSADQNAQLGLMRHSNELKGFGRTFTTMDNLIRTISDSVTLNSNQILTINGDLQTRTDQQTTTVALLTQMLSNHSIDIQHLSQQIATLENDVQNRASIRVVVPTQVPPIVHVPTTETSTVSTTTTTLGPVPKPSGLTVISSTSTSISLTWIPVHDPTVQNYRIVVQNIHGAHDSTQVLANAPPVTVGNLDPDGRYLITLYAARDGDLSRPLNALGQTLPGPRPVIPPTTTTSPALPPPPTTPDANAIVPSHGYPDQVHIADMADFYCDFEDFDLCNFLDDTTDDFDWIRNNGTTPSADTGPSRDHTLGTDDGHYMFIEASRPRQPGDRARLVSPLMEPTSGQCLEFYYHMFGVGTGELLVHVQHAGATQRTQVWADSGNHGDQWKRGKTTITSDLPFQIVFEGIRGTDYHSDIGFDDVIIKSGACPKPMLQCRFEDDNLCGFTQDSDDEFDWNRNSGATSSADTGPISDHTFGTPSGHYIYLEASNPRYPGDTTRISSPTLNPTNGQCLRFYYHMHGVDIGHLKVYMRQTSQPNDLGIAIWSKYGAQGNDWILGRTSIVSTESFQVVFEGTRGDDYHGDMALDDIVITDGPCDQPVCPVGRKFGDLCYKVEETGRTYQDASNLCKSNGGLLVAVKTQEQQNFLADLVNGYGNEWTLFWVGIDDMVTEGRFVYSDGMPLAMSDQSFQAWAKGEPNDALGDEDCVNMDYQSKHRRWNDVPCNRENWFICQYPVSM